MHRIGAHSRKRGVDRDRQRESSLCEQRFDLTRQVEHERFKLDNFPLYVETSCCHFREVENLVDKLAKMVCRGRNTFDRTCLTIIQFPIHTVPQQLDEADDCIEWGPQLVRHVSEKFTLHAVGSQQLGRQSLELCTTIRQP